MPVNSPIRLLVLALVLSSWLPPPVGGQSRRSLPPIIDSYPRCGTSDASHFTSVDPSIIYQAMLGVDPSTFDPYGKRNLGLKDRVFDAFLSTSSSSSIFDLKNVIGKATEDVRCPPLSSLSMRTLRNYNSYRDALEESVRFKSGDNTTVGSRFLCSTSSSEGAFESIIEKENFVEFFRRGGEVVLGEAECQTHTVSVNLNTRPTFTQSFHKVLGKLSLAAEDCAVNKSWNAFIDFFQNFGTHYQARTHFGSRLLIMKLFARKAANFSESSERHRCVSSAFTQNLHQSDSLEEAIQQFRSAVSQCPDYEQAPDLLNSLGLSPTRILTAGTVPLPDQSLTLQRPVPIHYTLEKISGMFEKDWFEQVGCIVDGKLMAECFEAMKFEYTNSRDVSCAAARQVGCGYNSNCPAGEKCLGDNATKEGFFCKKFCEVPEICPNNTICVDDESPDGYSCKRCGVSDTCPPKTVCVDDESPDGYSCKRCGVSDTCPPNTVCVDDATPEGFSCRDPCTVPGTCAAHEACYAEQHSLRGHICVSTKPGSAVILGGGGDTGRLQAVESVNLESFPELPAAVSSSAAAAAQGYVVLCGGLQWGERESSAECYRLSLSAPGGGWEAMPSAPFAMATHSAVGMNQTVWFIDVDNLVVLDLASLAFRTRKLPFTAHGWHCAVGNGTHAHVVGAGGGRDEIWVNERAMDGSEWRRVARMTRGRHSHACLWYGSNIMVAGGWEMGARADVEMFNTETGDVWAGPDLLTGRSYHQMMLLDGRPTVLGGYGGRHNLDSFESFSLASNRWEKLARTLARPKGYFSVVEV